MEVLAALYPYGPMGFSELRRRLSGITSRTLPSKLKVLEGTGLVRREVRSERPPRVMYFLTEGGELIVRLGELVFLLTRLLQLRAAGRELSNF